MIWLLLACSTAPAATTDCPLRARELGVEDPRVGSAIVVRKGERRLQVFQDGQSAGCWKVGLATGYETGDKLREGDMKTPEGWYRTSDKPASSHYSAIAVHYPNAEDAQRGLDESVIDEPTYESILSALEKDKKPSQQTSMGGEILIHGGGGADDWTLGCLGMENEDIDALRSHLPEGMRVNLLILP